jgi:hypothetical protein
MNSVLRHSLVDELLYIQRNLTFWICILLLHFLKENTFYCQGNIIIKYFLNIYLNFYSFFSIYLHMYLKKNWSACNEQYKKPLKIYTHFAKKDSQNYWMKYCDIFTCNIQYSKQNFWYLIMSFHWNFHFPLIPATQILVLLNKI